MKPTPPPPARLPPRDLLREAAAGLLARPARVALTVLGTVIGVGALVATLGLSKTAGNQIVGRFSEVAATDVVVSPVPGALGGSAAREAIPWDAEARLLRLNGVREAGTLSDVNVRGVLARSVPINDPLGQTEVQLPVKAASPGLWRAVRAQLAAGRFPDRGHSIRGDRTVVLGMNAARRLGISNLDQQPAIFIGDRLYQVSGLVRSVDRQPSLIGSITIPEGTARQEFGLAAPGVGAGGDGRGRSRARRPAGADGAQPQRTGAAARGRAARSQDASRGGGERPERIVPAARRRVIARGRTRDRERHARAPCSSASARSAFVERSGQRAGTSPRNFSWKARRWVCWAGSWGPASARWWLWPYPPAGPGRRCWIPGCHWPHRSPGP